MRIGNALVKVLVLLGFVCVSFFAMLFYSAYRTWNPRWTEQTEILGPDGYTYSFMNMSFLMGQEMKLVREKPGHPDSYEELGSVSGDSSLNWASVIRSANPTKYRYGQLLVGGDNVILGMGFANRCYFTYDIGSHAFYGDDAVETLSPFILIESQTALHEPDILATILETVKNSHWNEPEGMLPDRKRDYSRGCPNPQVLNEGLKHPNREVQKLSKWLLEIQENGLSYSSDIIHEVIDFVVKEMNAEDIHVREYAVKVPGYFQIAYAENAIPSLEKALYEDKTELSSDAAISLGRMGQKAFPVLLKCLKSRNSSVRFYGLLGFRFAGSSAASQVKEIVPLLKDRNGQVRSQALRALEAIQYYDEELVSIYEELKQARDKKVREYAESALQQINLKGLDHDDKK